MARAARAPRPGHGAEAFLIDTKFAGASKSLRHRVEEELLRDVRRILLTHSHCDHADGLERYHPASTMSWWPRVLEATSEAARLTVTPPLGRSTSRPSPAARCGHAPRDIGNSRSVR